MLFMCVCLIVCYVSDRRFVDCLALAVANASNGHGRLVCSSEEKRMI